MITLTSVIFVALGFGFVIAIHEFGHFIFAKWAGVRVDVFSIGMGPVIYRKRYGETDYVLSLLPVGGYVKMLGQEDIPGRDVDTDNERSFATKSAGWRALILLGGVLFNLVSSYIILLALAFYGMPYMPPVVGNIVPEYMGPQQEIVESPAVLSGLKSGDKILRIDGQKMRSFDDIFHKGLTTGEEKVQIEVERNGEVVALDPVSYTYNAGTGRPELGIAPALGRTIARSRLMGGQDTGDLPQQGEEIVSFRVGEKTTDLSGEYGLQVYNALMPYIGDEIYVRLEKGGVQREVQFRYAGPAMFSGGTAALGFPVWVTTVVEDGPADSAGVVAGDILSAIDGEVFYGFNHMRGKIFEAAAVGKKAVTVTVQRWRAGEWQAQELSMPLVVNPHNDNPIIGISVASRMTGVLAPMDKVFEATNPLKAAGLTEADAVIAYDINQENPETPMVQIQAIEAGAQYFLTFSKEDWRALVHQESIGMMGRLAGMSPEKMLVERVAGARIEEVSAEEGRLIVRRFSAEVPDGQRESVTLASLSEAGRKIMSMLEVGDWIAADAYDQSLQVIRSPSEKPRLLNIEAVPTGVALSLLPANEPYELESFGEAFTLANHETWQIIHTTLNVIPRFFRSAEDGGIDASRSLAGPIGIFQETSARFNLFGFDSYLKFIAMLGVNLFFINLLPIPIVDGGQLMFLGIEVILRRPVPEKVVGIANLMGFILIVWLMLYVTGNDIVMRILS